MKKFTIGVCLVIFLASISVFAKPKRITFKKGAPRAVVTGNLAGYQSRISYIVRLRGGQTLKLSSNRYITLAITDPSGVDVTDHDASCNGSKTIAASVAGDYRIAVVECRKADAWRGNFKLFVSAK